MEEVCIVGLGLLCKGAAATFKSTSRCQPLQWASHCKLWTFATLSHRSNTREPIGLWKLIYLSFVCRVTTKPSYFPVGLKYFIHLLGRLMIKVGECILHTLLCEITCLFGISQCECIPIFLDLVYSHAYSRHSARHSSCSSSSRPTTNHPPPTTHHPPPTTHHPPPQPFFRCRAGTARSCTFSRHVQVASVRIVFNCMKLFAFFNFLDTFSCIFLCRCILFFVLSTGLTLRHNAP